jgi:Domain of unknown function (DUF5667)
MISLTSATKRAEEFDAAVSGRTAQDHLRPELAELLDVVGAMRGIDAPAPRPDFVASLRERLLEEAETALTRDAVLTLPPRRKGRERRLALAASAFVLVGGTAGMAAAAQNALPGDALYPIKRGIEAAQTDLSRGEESKGQHLLDQAGSRLHEVELLLATDASAPQVEATLDDFVGQANEGSQLLLGSYQDQQDPATVDQVRDFTSASMDDLAALAQLAPADLQGSFQQAAGALEQIDQQAATACTSCVQGRPALRLAPAFSATADAQRALRALSAAKINNDHPTIGGIKDPAGQRDGSRQGGSDDATSGDSGSTGVTGGDDTSVLPDLGDTAGGLTGGTDTSTGGGGLGDVTGPVQDQVKKVKDAAPAPLDDALDQLLP